MAQTSSGDGGGKLPPGDNVIEFSLLPPPPLPTKRQGRVGIAVLLAVFLFAGIVVGYGLFYR